MPRKAPDKVIEHRISLSDFERKKILEQIELQRENALYVAGVNQIGGVAGSGVLLWGLGLYFGKDIIESIYDKTQGWIDRSSTRLANAWTQAFGGITPEEGAWFTQQFDLLDERIRQLNRKEQLDESAINGATAQFRAGDIDYEMYKGILDAVGEIPKPEDIEERARIAEARQKLLRLQAQADKGWLEQAIQNWGVPVAKDVADLILGL